MLNIFYQNVRGLRTKLTAFASAVSCFSVDLDVIILTETWLTEGFLDSELGLHNFNIYRMDRGAETSPHIRGGGGGGVLIAVRRSIRSARVTVQECGVEQLLIKIKLALRGAAQ